jgi:uncharacterized protein YdeI (YjbR/CyaY-like superfamily)
VPSVVPNPRAIRPFASEAAFEAWLAKNHDRATEIWIKIYKKSSGKPSIDASQAIDVCLCWGWIDGVRKSFDEEAFLQRYTPRTAKSRWSQINVERVARLVKAGRMTPHGQVQVDAAKGDGRWQAAYPSPKSIQVPAEFLKALSQQPRALKTFQALARASVYSIAYRLHHLKTPAGRAKYTAGTIEKLARGEDPHSAPKKATRSAPRA